MEDNLSTADRIIQAALKLMIEKGFAAVSMKDIAAAAKTCEMNVFRHFSSKQGVLEAVIERCSFVPSLKEIFENKLTGNLRTDLLMISSTYHQIMEKNKNAVILLIKEKTFLAAKDWEKLPPYHFKRFMVAYLKDLESQGKLSADVNIEVAALSFITMNFGFFYSKITLDRRFVDISTKTYIENSTQLFAKALLKCEIKNDV
ncbi:TetR/AcrR family transcriptional regulator [Pectinatus frisingensis]|uniref:TetR/AcrR family transcriptional regulator n=1 Tax=Pectinatus frisingensis TaxID=865 RepID=UPI0018C69AF6|nr:TetR/AcrR family transcriptional regulator [Pectinatus frisingensis]